MSFEFINLFCQHAAASFDKQLHLHKLVGREDWYFNMASGLLSFGQHLHFHTQILGTESYQNNTWLWAWANEGSNIPATLLRCAIRMKELGDQRFIEELAEPQLPLGKVNGHALCTIASNLCGADAYYHCPYEGGAAFLLINDDTFPACADPPLSRIVAIFPQAISSLEIPNHKLALTGYLDYYRLAFAEDGNQVIVKEGTESMLTASFNEQNCLMKLEATLKPRDSSRVEERQGLTGRRPD